jgi:hypothetical protein
MAASVQRAEQSHAAIAFVEMKNSTIQFISSAGNELERVADIACDENDGSGSEKGFGQNLVEAPIPRIKKD